VGADCFGARAEQLRVTWHASAAGRMAQASHGVPGETSALDAAKADLLFFSDRPDRSHHPCRDLARGGAIVHLALGRGGFGSRISLTNPIPTFELSWRDSPGRDGFSSCSDNRNTPANAVSTNPRGRRRTRHIRRRPHLQRYFGVACCHPIPRASGSHPLIEWRSIAREWKVHLEPHLAAAGDSELSSLRTVRSARTHPLKRHGMRADVER